MSQTQEGEDTNKKSIVLLTIDSLRADHCSFMGYDQETTPTIDSMAQDGLVFENAIAPGPSTSESVPAMFTGHYPVNRSETKSAIDGRIDRIGPHMKTRRSIAKRFSEQGYRTAAFTPNPFTSRYFGYGPGFDHYQDFLEGSRASLYERFFDGVFSGNRLYMPVRVLMNWLQREEAFKPWESFYDEIVEWVSDGDKPYFIWIFLMDVHHPYLPSGDYRSISRPELYYANWKLRYQNYQPPLGEKVHENLVQAYDDAISYTDSFIESLRNDLPSDPAVVVTADHGESFGEHGTYEHHGGAFGQEGEQEYHSYLYEENIHVPLVISNAGRSGTVKQPVSLRSLPELLMATAVGDELKPETYTRPFVTSQSMDAEKVAVRGERYKYIQTSNGSELYDLQKGEQSQLEAPDLRSSLMNLAKVTKQSREESETIVNAVSDITTENTF